MISVSHRVWALDYVVFMCELVLLLGIRTFRKCLVFSDKMNAAVRRSIKRLQFETMVSFCSLAVAIVVFLTFYLIDVWV